MKEALAVAHHTGEKSYLAELYRIRGELLLVQQAGYSRSRALVSAKIFCARTNRC